MENGIASRSGIRQRQGMATYAIGDIHGCFETLQALWPQLGFDERRDRLWLVGDLVNRGPGSLKVLRWAREMNKRLGDRMWAVLGNHDLHLLAMHDGYARARRKDTLEDVLSAPDRDELVEWLAQKPLAQRDGQALLIHAGLLPRWTLKKAMKIARRLESSLRDPERRQPLIDRSFEPTPDSRWIRARAQLNAFVGLRTCTADGEPCKHKGPPQEAPAGCLPWFQVPHRRSSRATIVFGHWAALGLHLEESVIGLDSGCVWGQRLTAIRLEDRALFHQETVDVLPPILANR